jgi:O-antigen/teichoic acid export membrane protein
MEPTNPPTEAAPRSVGRAILRNALFVTGGGIALKAMNFLYGVFVVRQLGDDRFGNYNIILAWVGLFSIFAELGITQYAFREIARDHSKANSLFWDVLAVRALLAVTGMIGITAGAAAIGYAPEIVLGVFVYTCSFLFSALQASLDMVVAAHERLDYTTGTFLVGQVASMLLGLIVLLTGQGLVVFIAVGLASMWVPILASAWVVRRHKMLVFRPQLNRSHWVGLIRGGFPFAVITLALTIAFSIDTVMLSWSVAPNQVGWYNVAYGLARSIVSFLGGFTIALVPSLTRAFVNDTALVERWYFRSVKFISILALPAAMGGMFVAHSVIALLYNPTTLPAAAVLQVIIWDVPLLMFTALCGNMSYVVGAERAAARIYGLNALANVILNFYAIPRYGIMGAAVVTVVTDLIGAVQFYLELNRHLKLPDLRPMLARVVFATLIMGAALWLAPAWHVVVLIALGGVAYVTIVLAVGVLDASEIALLRQNAQRIVAKLQSRRPAGP